MAKIRSCMIIGYTKLGKIITSSVGVTVLIMMPDEKSRRVPLV